MALSLPPTGTNRLLELVSPYVPDAFIHDLCPRQFTGGRRCALSAPQVGRLHLLPLLTSTHSLNLVVAQLPEQAAWRRFCRLRRHWPGVRMAYAPTTARHWASVSRISGAVFWPVRYLFRSSAS